MYSKPKIFQATGKAKEEILLLLSEEGLDPKLSEALRTTYCVISDLETELQILGYKS